MLIPVNKPRIPPKIFLLWDGIFKRFTSFYTKGRKLVEETESLAHDSDREGVSSKCENNLSSILDVPHANVFNAG